MVNPLSAGKKILDAKSKLKKMQDDMRNIQASGESDKGRVKVTLNGVNEMVKIEIIDELLASDKKDMLTKAIISASNDAKKKLDKELEKNMRNNMDMSQIMEMFK
jgi:DNA-binding YbaB/EbfC family protein